MTISAVSKRLAATGVATALTAGALVAGTAGTATAAVSGGATYVCTVPVIGAVEVPVSFSTDSLPTELLADSLVAGGVGSPVEAVVGLPAQLTGLLSMLGLTELGAGLPGFSMLLGGAAVPLEQLAAPLAAVSDSATLTGFVGSFTAPAKAGDYDLELPRSIALAPLGNVPLPVDSLPCTLKEGQSAKVATMRVAKQTSKVKVVKAVKKGQGATVVTKVVRQDGKAAAGKVVALVQGKKVAAKGLQAGKATLKVRNIKGSKVVVKYLGNSSTQGAKKAATVR